MRRLFVPLLIFSLSLPSSLDANPFTLQYAGRLLTNKGKPLSGPVSLTINFYNAASGGTVLAVQSFTNVTLQDGLFSLNIDLGPSSFETVFASSEVWIEVVESGSGKIYPRQKFGSVPYAFKVPTDGLTLGYDTTGKLRVQGLGPAALPAGNPSDGQILKWKDGTGWEWGADNAGGSGAGSVDTAAILDGTIANADVAANAAIAGSKIVPNFGAQNIVTTGTITGDGSTLTNLPAGPLGTSIDGSEIAAGSISDTHIAAGAAIAQSKIDGLSAALAAREGSIAAGTAAQYYRGDKTWATLDTSAVPENVNLYYTDARARAALSASAPLSYNSTTGALTITSASGVSAGTISAAEFLSFSAKQAAITAASTVNTGSLTTALQPGVEINPFGTNVGESGELRFKELAASGSNYIGFKAPDAIASDRIYVLPAVDGSVGQFLSTDGSGNLSWGSVGGAAGGTVTSITAGTGLSGGTITGSGTINLANTAVTPGSYTRSNITVDAQGRVTAAASGASVNLTSEVTGALPLSNGGTGATTAGDARTSLGLGALATENAVDLSSQVSGALALASGGTGATTAANARTALGLGALATESSVNLATQVSGSLPLASGGTGATTAGDARTALGLGGLAILNSVGAAEITDATIANADISAAAGIVDTKLDTISTAGKVSNSATTATSANTASAIVARDPSGDFTAGTITASLNGNAATATSAASVSGTVALANGGTGATTAALARTALGLGALATANSVDLATATTGSLSITSGGTGATTAAAARTNLGLGGLATLSAVGAGEITDDSIANADISAAAGIIDTKLATISTAGKVSNSATTAASANTASAIVARDGSGNFAAGTITATLSGNATSATTAGNVSGTIAIANGGTGATTAALARTALGLGSLATLSAVGSSDITDAAIVNDDLSASAAIDASKIADGSVSSAEFQYINSLTGNAQTQIDTKANAANPSFTGVISAPLGAVGAPSYTLSGDPNTGIWSSGADKLDFSTAGVHRLTIGTTGYVGIGTTDPTEKLDLGVGNLRLRSPSGGIGYLEFAEDEYTYERMGIAFDGASDGKMYITSTYSDTIPSSSNALISINAANGYMGIGTINPLSQLDVIGSASVKASPSIVLTGSIDPTASTTLNGIGTLFTSELAIGDRITVSGQTRTVVAIASDTSLTVDTATTNTANDTSPDRLPSALAVKDSSNAVKFIVNDAGNVGIGTTNPSNPLDLGPVAGLTAGSATAKKLAVLKNGDDFYGLGVSTNTLEFHAGSTSSEIPGMSLLADGKVGIGITSPDTSTLHVVRNSSTTLATDPWNATAINVENPNQTNGTMTGLLMTTRDSNSNSVSTGAIYSIINNHTFANVASDLVLSTTTSNSILERMRILANGNVGIGTTNPSYKLTVNGSILTSGSDFEFRDAGVSDSSAVRLFSNSGFLYLQSGSGNEIRFRSKTATSLGILNNSGNLWIAGTYSQSSDERLKKDIITTPHALDDVMALRGVNYLWKDPERSNELQLGLIAQEVEKIVPEVVLTNVNGEKSVAYAQLVPMLIEATKELKNEKDAEIARLLREAAELKARADQAEEEAKQLKAESQKKDSTIQRIAAESSLLKAFLCSKFEDAPLCSK